MQFSSFGHMSFCHFLSRMFPDIRALLSSFSCPPFSRQRREKIERRQQEVETELKMCKSLFSSHLFFFKPSCISLRLIQPRTLIWEGGGFSPQSWPSTVFGLGFRSTAWGQGWWEGRPGTSGCTLYGGVHSGRLPQPAGCPGLQDRSVIVVVINQTHRGSCWSQVALSCWSKDVVVGRLGLSFSSCEAGESCHFGPYSLERHVSSGLLCRCQASKGLIPAESSLSNDSPELPSCPFSDPVFKPHSEFPLPTWSPWMFSSLEHGRVASLVMLSVVATQFVFNTFFTPFSGSSPPPVLLLSECPRSDPSLRMCHHSGFLLLGHTVTV